MRRSGNWSPSLATCLLAFLATVSAHSAQTSELNRNVVQKWIDALDSVNTSLHTSPPRCGVPLRLNRPVRRGVTFYELPNGCSDAPDLGHNAACNEHDFCYMRMPPPGSGFLHHFENCNRTLDRNIETEFQKHHGANVAPLYYKAVELFGYKRFLNSQARQAQHLFRGGARVGFVYPPRLPTAGDLELANFCASYENETRNSLNPTFSDSEASKVGSDLCPKPLHRIQSSP